MLFTFSIALVNAYLTIKTGKRLPAIILHALSNIYCAYIPIGTGLIHPALSVLFMNRSVKWLFSRPDITVQGGA